MGKNLPSCERKAAHSNVCYVFVSFMFSKTYFSWAPLKPNEKINRVIYYCLRAVYCCVSFSFILWCFLIVFSYWFCFLLFLLLFNSVYSFWFPYYYFFMSLLSDFSYSFCSDFSFWFVLSDVSFWCVLSDCSFWFCFLNSPHCFSWSIKLLLLSLKQSL